MSNYFDFYGLEEAFFIDESELKRLYFQKSKEFHPDFHRNDNEKYAKALEQSSLNNSAYNVLKSFNSRLKYILERNKVLSESKNAIPQSFLMEMMEVNEGVMDLQMDYEAAKAKTIVTEVNEIQENLESDLNRLAKHADAAEKSERKELLEKLKELYLKQKYVLRIKESLDKFASH